MLQEQSREVGNEPTVVGAAEVAAVERFRYQGCCAREEN